MGSDESHLNVSLIVKDKVTKCPQTTTFEEKAEPKRNRTEVFLLTSLTPYRLAKSLRPSTHRFSADPEADRVAVDGESAASSGVGLPVGE